MEPAREEPQQVTVAVEPAVAVAAAPASGSAGPALSEAGIMRLQRSAGNAAVSRMIARSKDPAPPKQKPVEQVIRITNNDVPSAAWFRANGFRYRSGMPEMWINAETGVQYWILSPPEKQKREAPPPPAPDAPVPEGVPEDKDLWDANDEDSAALAEARDLAAQMMKRVYQMGPLFARLPGMRAAGEGHSDHYDDMLDELDDVLREFKLDIDEFDSQVPDWREEIHTKELDEEELPELEKLVSYTTGAKVMHGFDTESAADLRANREPPEQPAVDDDAQPQDGQEDPGDDAGEGADEGEGGGGDAGGGQPAE